MLSAAFQYASDQSESIGECSAPADAGGYVFQLPEHNLIIANAGGVYIEIELGSDPHYDSTGLHRIHVRTCATQISGSCVDLKATLGPSAGPPQENGGVGIGAFWAFSADNTTLYSLGNMTYKDISGATLVPGWDVNSTSLTFSVEYFLLSYGLLITESYVLQSNPPSIQLTTSATTPGREKLYQRAKELNLQLTTTIEHEYKDLGTLSRFGVTFPALTWDGVTNSSITINTSKNIATITDGIGGGLQNFNVNVPSGHNLTWIYNPENLIVARNGLITPILAEISCCSSSTPSLTLSLLPTMS